MSRMIRLIFVLAILGLVSGCLKSETLEPEPSALDLDVMAPSCPGLNGVTVTAGPSLSVTWGEAADSLTSTSAITYSIFVRSGYSNYDLVSPSRIVIGATSALLTQGIQLGQTYTLFVTCKDEKGNVAPAGPTNEITVTVSDNVPPTAPSPLAIGGANFTSLLLTWGGADDGAGGTTSSQMRYRIYRSTSPNVSTLGSPLITLTAANSYTDPNLIPGTTYYYRVVALDLANNLSMPSNEASGLTLPDVTPPSLTPNLNISSVSTDSIGLTWSAGSDNVTAPTQLVYLLYRCSGSTTCDPYGSSHIYESAPGQNHPPASPYLNSSLSPNTIYVYGVRVRDSSGNISTNTDRLVTSTAYSSAGDFEVYPNNEEVGILFGQGVTVANVVGVPNGATGAFPDLIVGAPAASQRWDTFTRTGCFYIFPGTATGVFSSTPSQTICNPSPGGNGANNRNFGNSLVSGDLDGNGTQDLVVGSPQQNRFYIYLTESVLGGPLAFQNPVAINKSDAGTGFAWNLCLGDSDGQGALDIFAVSPFENCAGSCSGLTGTGNVHIYSNISSGGNFTLPSLQTTISPTAALLSAPNSFVLQSNERVVMSCAVGRFDPNAPAQDILVLGSGLVDHDNNSSANDGIVSFYRKTAADTWNYQNTIVGFVNNPPQLRDGRWGDTVLAIQVDGTGQPELFVGAPNDSSAGAVSGAVYGYSVQTFSGNFALQDLGVYFYGGSDQNNNWAGTALAAANIWGHSGTRQDLVIGAAYDDRSLFPSATSLDMGDVFTYRNNNGILSAVIQQQRFDVQAVNARIENEFGRSLCKGDVNNDGREDVMVGSPGQSYDPNSLTYSGFQGALYIYYGRPAGEIDFANPSQILFGPGNQGSAGYGYSCLVMDYNSDGKMDLLVGSPWRDIGPNWDRGAVYIYYGETNTPIPTNPGATLNAPYNESALYFGFSLAKGNLDGVTSTSGPNNDDLIVGSPFWDSGGVDTGGAWIFWANATTGAIMPATSVTTILPPYGNVGTAGNPHLGNDQVLGAGGSGISSMARSGNQVTVTTSQAHNLGVANSSGPVVTGSISAMSRTSNVVTVTTSAPHGLTALDTIFIDRSTATTNGFNGCFTVASVPSATTFTYSQGGENEAAVVTSAVWSVAMYIWGSSSPSATSFNGCRGLTGVPNATTFTFDQVGPNESATLSPTSASFFYRQRSSHFGYSIATFPTVPGSTGEDLVVCQPWRDTTSGYIDGSVGGLGDVGTCFIYEGAVNGGLVGPYQIMTRPRNEIRYPFVMTNFASSVYFGTAITRGRWDNDSVDDLVICAHRMRNLDLGISNLGGCFAFFGRKAGPGGFQTTTGYRPGSNGRLTPLSNDYYYNPKLEGEATDFGVAVLLMDVNNNVRHDLLIGEPLSDNFQGPANLGRNSGRVRVDRCPEVPMGLCP